MDNKDILNEAFFKKASYEEKRKSRLPQYAPVELKKNEPDTSVPNYASNLPSYEVNDTREVKKRLANTFGVAFGNNNIKSLASRALKTFPILVSENVQPETVVMLKKLMEEQYAEYINLLISNQVIDLSAYRSGDHGDNIALQALDDLSDNNLRGKAALADKIAKKDGFDPDDMFQNIPLYNLLRENAIYVEDDETVLSKLLEGVAIVPSENAEALVEFMETYADDIVSLNEFETAADTATLRGANYSVARRGVARAGDRHYRSIKDMEDEADMAIASSELSDIKRGSLGLDKSGKEVLTKLTSADIVVDEDKLDAAINRSVGDILCDPQNAIIRDRFEKATFLLQSRRISGKEYYQYLTIRLGIPVSDKAKIKLMLKYKASDIINYSVKSGKLTKKQISDIENSRKISDPVIDSIWNSKIKNGLLIAGAGATGAATGLGVALGTGAIKAGALTPELILGALGGGAVAISIVSACAVGGAALAAALGYILAKKLKAKYKESKKIEGWERVEALIDAMDENQADVLNKYGNHASRTISAIDTTDSRILSNLGTSKYSGKGGKYNPNNAEAEAEGIAIGDYYKSYVTSLRNSLGSELSADEERRFDKDVKTSAKKLSLAEGVEAPDTYTYDEETKAALKEQSELVMETLQEMIDNDELLRKEILAEKNFGSFSRPVNVKVVSKKPDEDVLIAPTEYSGNPLNYGSVEIDHKESRDRRYNQPLVMTIKFKGRYDDGRTSDSALTAVIGILGKVIRVPSNEMEAILKANAQEDSSIKGVLAPLLGNKLDNTIADLLSNSKLKAKDDLPISGETWRNLEKVATLAASNTVAGRKNKNLANAHIIFSQKEIDSVRSDIGVNYLHDIKKTAALMKKYSAFTLMIANDPSQYVYIFDDLDSPSWSQVPYSALTGRDGSDQLNTMLNRLSNMRI